MTSNYGYVLKKMCFGKKHLFIHAAAGCGKSYLIHRMQERVSEGVLFVAPSGIAALNIHGATVHSMFGLRPAIQLPQEDNKTPNDSIFCSAHTILIDEISMVRCDLLDKIDRVLQLVRGNSLPFGGIRVIIVGDLFQLGCIVSKVDSPILQQLYPDAHGDYSFFNSNVFRNMRFLSNLEVYELMHNFRQEADTALGNVLSLMRMGSLNNNMLDSFNLITACNANKFKDTTFRYLTCTNSVAEEFNNLMLLSLKDKATLSPPFVQWYTQSGRELAAVCPINKNLLIKEGMQIVFCKNDSIINGKRWCNGTVGKVEKKIFSNNVLSSVIISVDGIDHEVFRENYEIYGPVYDIETFTVKTDIIAVVENYPFIPAWASTIHKSQGLTLGNIVVDLGQGAFLPGQAYVALSRAKSMQNIMLSRPIEMEDIIVSKTAKRFYEALLPNIKFIDKK